LPERAAAFLGVTRSFSGKRWRLRLTDERAGLALSQHLGVPEIVGRVLAARGVAPETAEGFLDPTLKNSLPDPSHLRDMDTAAARLAGAVVAGETIAVFGDYDVDGATSAALLLRFFAGVGVRARAYIPDRRREGYGPNAPALAKLRAEGASLVVTVDCGTLAHEALSEARRLGLDVIVVDHHEAEPALPPAVAVVNPNRLDEDSPHKQLAAVGVTFLLVVAVNRALRARGWYGAAGRSEPDLMAWLDLVALGTICDVVPLTGLNRALVAQGLKVMAGRANVGLAALADVARLEGRPTAYHAAYMLGPRVNAGGRVGQSDLGLNLLVAEDADEARGIAATLDSLNAERRRIESEVLASAEAQAEALGPAPLVLVAGEGWHVGVIGIVAARLKERFGRPACVIGIENGVGKGSGRSIRGVDLGAAVIAARQKGLLMNGGGHAMAAGFTVEQARIGPLRDFLSRRVEAETAASPLDPGLGIDGALAPEAATRDLAGELERIGPFGTGNAEPRFVFPAVRLAMVEVAGDHVRCMLAGAGTTIKGIAFRAADTDLGRELLRLRGGAVHVAGRLARDDWRGREGVQFFIDDAAAARPH
jgi:single-stranded-DNA-specific exonuclease